MQDKQKDLKSVKQRKALERLMAKLASKTPSVYYLSTVEVAAELHAMIESRQGLSTDDVELLADLSTHDIQMLLSIHH